MEKIGEFENRKQMHEDDWPGLVTASRPESSITVAVPGPTFATMGGGQAGLEIAARSK